MSRPHMISFDDFTRVDIRVGRIVEAERFPEARKPAFKLRIDFGPELGVKKSSAQLTMHYQPDDLIGRLVLAVVNFPPRQIGPFMSEVLTLGVPDPIRGGGAGGAGARGAAGRAAVLGRRPHRRRGTRRMTAAGYAVTHATINSSGRGLRGHTRTESVPQGRGVTRTHADDKISSPGPRRTRTHADKSVPQGRGGRGHTRTVSSSGPRMTRTHADSSVPQGRGGRGHADRSVPQGRGGRGLTRTD